MSESSQLIANSRTLNSARGREERLSKRLAERVGVRLLARGGQRYVDAVLEGLGDPSQAFMACDKCKRPYVQEWAVREMGHAMNRAMGHPQVQVQMLAMIQQLGVRDEAEARSLIGMARSVEGLDADAAAEMALRGLQEHYRSKGWRLADPYKLEETAGEPEPSGSARVAGNGPSAAVEAKP